MDKNLLYEYLVFLSKDNLTFPVRFFESLKSSYDLEILDTIESITSLAIDCVYSCTDPEMYLKAKAIFDGTVAYSTGREDSTTRYKELEKELKCLQTLNLYQVKIPLFKIKESKQNFVDAKMLLIQMSDNFKSM